MKVADEEEIFLPTPGLRSRHSLSICTTIWVRTSTTDKRLWSSDPTYVFDAQASKGIGLHNLGWFHTQ